MPWKASSVMDERVRFIGRLLEGESMAGLCREYGISRKTGYKFRDRYLAHGVRGLVDVSRRPQYHPHKTEEATERLIVRLRKIKPSWGPKKLQARLQLDHPGLQLPSVSTIDAILNRYGVAKHPTKHKRYKAQRSGPLRQSHAPNDIWCVDFKGQFRLGNRNYCYPLTITDHYSRFILGCEALESTETDGAWSSFERVFQCYGLPRAIRSDNGVPFSSRSMNGWSQLSVWWLRLGIELERIEPGHPEQNGRHERMHWTLKREATRPASPSLFHQQSRFDHFRHEFNCYRPHEALEMRTPSVLYVKSDCLYPAQLPELDYPLHDMVRTVDEAGRVYLRKRTSIHLSAALRGEDVGLKEIKPYIWQVNFMTHDLGVFDETTKIFSQKQPVPPPV